AEQGSRSPNAEEASAHHGTMGTPSGVTLVTNAARDSARGSGSDADAHQATSPQGGTTDVDREFPVVRALYVNRFAAQSAKRMRQLIQIADETEINALVIDMKDEFGLNFKTQNPEFARNAGTAGVVRNLPVLLDTLRAHKILPIARLVVFKDSVTARVHPEWTIRRQDNSVWRDKKGIAWVNPY